jgi:transcriptional regulator with XRE-family HTH domain
MSQKDLATKTELDPSYISLLEKGTRNPSMKNIDKIAIALEVPAHFLVMLSYDSCQLMNISEDDILFVGKQVVDMLIRCNPAP